MTDFALRTLPFPTPPAHSDRAEAISEHEWLRRFMARIHSVSGFCVNAGATWPEGYAGLSRGFEGDPEGAANEQLNYWLE